MSSNNEKKSPSDENIKLRPWKTEEVVELIRFFFKHREILVTDIREKKKKKVLNDLASDLISEDFKPSTNQIEKKFRDIILNAKKGTTAKTKAGLSHEPPFKKNVF